MKGCEYMLTPVDIENKDFKKVMRGYDIYEVESFIKDVVSDYEKLYRENSNMKEKIEMLTTSIANYRAMEETMQNAMIVAQSTSDDIKKNAVQKANNIIAEAEIKAKETVNAAEKEISDLKAKYQSLKAEIDGFKSRMKALILTYDKLLDDFPKNDASLASAEIEDKQIDIAEPIESKDEVREESVPAHKVTAKEEPVHAYQDKPSDIYEELKKVNKREQNQEEASQNPRLDKQNAILEEILTKNKEKSAAPVQETEERGAVREVVINLSNKEEKESGAYYDVFKDPTL